MALRDFYPLSEIPLQPMPELLDCSYELPEPEIIVAEKPLPYVAVAVVQAEEEPVLPKAQALAAKLEESRLSLLALLIENPISFNLLADQLSKPLSEGVDFTVLNEDKNTDSDLVQENFFVQDDKADAFFNKTTEAENSAFTEYASRHADLNRVRFFPAVLIKIAEQLSHDSQGGFDALFIKRLSESANRLQNLRQQMIVDNTGLVAFVAYKYKTTYLSFEDLMQEGVIGLIRAVDRFDPNRGIKFSTYAVFWIKQAILRLIIKQEKGVRLPVALAEKSTAVFEIMRNCYLEHNRWPSITELHAQCSLTIDEIKTISSYYQDTHSLDANIFAENDDHTLMDTLKQQQFALPLNNLIDQNLSLYLGRVVASLPEKEAAIISMRFGLKNQTEMTLQAIADQLNVTRERVRQIQNQALNKLKQQFGHDLLPFLEPNDS